MSEKKGKGKLSFSLSLPERISKGALPIEVRAANRKLVGRFDAADEPSVAPGGYFVSVRLPGGLELADWVDVTDGATAKVVLAADLGDDGEATVAEQVLAPRRSAASLKRELTDADGRMQSSLEHLKSLRTVAPGALVGVRAWKGKIGSFRPLDQAALHVETRRGRVEITIPPAGGEQCLLQLVVTGRPGQVVVAPQPEGRPCTFVVLRAGGELLLDAHLESPIADVIIRDATEVGRTLRAARALEARGLLQATSTDPIAATAGAVALLGTDQAEPFQSWMNNLATWFPWLPDGAAIAAESAARLGDHERAIEMLLLLEDRGIPLFTDALAWALDRLGRYVRSRSDEGTPRAARQGALRALRHRLQPFAAVGVSGRPLTTFRALDPNAPDDDRCGEALPPELLGIPNLMSDSRR